MIVQGAARAASRTVQRGANTRRYSGLFNPLALFIHGEQGVYYDPNDLATLFQDAAGTIPVTGPDQPVGLQLDKSRGLVFGPTIINNGSFDTDLGYGNGVGWTISGGSANFDGSTAFSILNTVATQSISGTTLKVEFTLLSAGVSVTQVRILIGGVFAAVVPVSGAGNYSAIVGGAASNGIALQTMNGSGAGYALVADNLSVRKIPGNHRFQTAAASRPMLRDTPRRLDYDGVDDSLVANFPASLGSNCTVVRSVPGVGAQILTGQTIGTSFADNVDSCAIVVINRALTDAETANLTRFMNQRAGV